ncbi:peptide-methionine (S)-S-oxide reductase MsrA [Candidatus Gottesmanbacteria bacterium]|nr:peptide-methionine (S)-S-oxide reductase MsrA [Candidatus Gottesmanbacteria bacterium]
MTKSKENELTEVAILAGGCFWCMEAVFERVKGVLKIVSGYIGGTTINPTYDEVCSGITGHVEAVQIMFDPVVITYETLLDVFFHHHDPTSKDKQGNDQGTQYRSIIFYQNETQKQIAEKYIHELNSSHTYSSPIVTEVQSASIFYPGEEYHQKYYEKNSYQPYCQYVIDQKIQTLYKDYGKLLKNKIL